MRNLRKKLQNVASVGNADPDTKVPRSFQSPPDDFTQETPRCGPEIPLTPEEEANEIDPEILRAFLRDYLPNPKAPERLKAWIREIPYRDADKK